MKETVLLSQNNQDKQRDYCLKNIKHRLSTRS